MTSLASETEASRALLVSMYDAVGQGDFATVLGLLAEDILVTEPSFLPYGGTYKGREAFQAFAGDAMQHLDVAKMVVERIIADGDRVIAILRVRALGTGEDVVLAEESLVREGQIAEIRVYCHDSQGLHQG
ncbi:nuclear transport factor 2 family protein [Sporichthya sp.]|uniref:nuclear transport factor 2 family protein n=1 Tax=Sporichthya sp. TaxID=65475 RepID=UPI0017BA776F|nr:nuclear transport factor 2 family protein [Sporichthya sp.]MBA3741455.1 nuclear transport factor 2 family protein [Sporichthya sp.]